ncbi:MAG: hypothetical protein J2P55_03765 [Rhizobiales bacterium]|nr:hypothetical protein [Hyphomicrobiales bacterium]
MPMDAGHDRTEVMVEMIRRGLLDARDAAMMTQDFYKPAGARCPHQKHHKGCGIYLTRPFGCRTWSCRWLTHDDTADLSRPDRSHYVIDSVPDYVMMNGQTVPVVQVWIDPDYPDAHEDPALRAFLLRRAEQDGYAALIRSSNIKAFALFAPPFTPNRTWRVEYSNVAPEHEHSAEDKVRALGGRPLAITVRIDR